MTEVVLLFGATGVGKTAVVSEILPRVIPPLPNGPAGPPRRPEQRGSLETLGRSEETVPASPNPPLEHSDPGEQNETCGFEVINADSIQVYKYLEIGSARPSPDVLARISHHLLDFEDPAQQFDVGEFVVAAEQLIPQIALRGRRVVVSGGTAFYLRTLMFGLPGTPPSDPGIRSRLQAECAEVGIEALRERLAAVDPESGTRIQSADTYRVIRALEVYEQTGRPLSSFGPPTEPRSDMKFLPVWLDRPREELYRRIEARVEKMFRGGLPDEVAQVLRMGYSEKDPGLMGIGYREFFVVHRELYGAPLEPGDWPPDFLQVVKERIKRNTRRFAKRQATFFARIPNAVRALPEEVEKLSLWSY